MAAKGSSTILLIGSDAALGYLLKRYAERGGYQFQINPETISSRDIAALNPVMIIFASMELLAGQQFMVKELTGLDAPILVCSSVMDETRARELGADYCLLHPLTYDEFQKALSLAAAPNRI